MKMKFLIVYFICSMILIGNFYALEFRNRNRFRNFANTNKYRGRKQNIRPNVHDIKRFLRPMITPPDQEYKPTEVDSLQDINKMSDGNKIYFIKSNKKYS